MKGQKSGRAGRKQAQYKEDERAKREKIEQTKTHRDH